jgi:A1 cistron-splicing factor AAR2
MLSKGSSMLSDDETGAVLMIPDVPLGLDFGINCMSFETGPKFIGMSMIPKGLHFIYHSTGMASRQGFFWRAGSSEVAVCRWDSFEEHIRPRESISDEAKILLVQQLKRGDLNNNLGAYPVAEHHVWLNLTCFIYESVLSRANCPVGEIIYPSEAQDLATLNIVGSSGTKPRSKTADETWAVESKSSQLQGNFAQFVNILAAEVTLTDEIRGAQLESRANDLTSIYLDKSLILEHLVATEYNLSWENVLGEMQLSFMLFLLIFCYDALDHWKKLVDTICRSEKALIAKPDFAVAFMRILYEQLNFAPTDFFVNELSKDNFLRPAVSSLFENLKQPRGVLKTSVVEHRNRLLNFFQKKFNLFEQHDEEVKSMQNSVNVADDNYNLVGEDNPVVVLSSEIDAYEERSSGESHAMIIDEDKSIEKLNGDLAEEETSQLVTPAQISIAMFNWRYPNLYDNMVAAGLNEDLEMAAVRILSESEEREVANTNRLIPDKERLLILECIMFLEGEASRKTPSE